MKSKFVRVFLAVAVTLTFSALAQTGSAATPSSPGATPANPPAAASANPPTTPRPSITMTGTKVGAINIEGAIFSTNEGRKEVEALQKKFEPKQSELKTQNDELEALKKQLDTQGPKLNEDAAATLKKQIESKQKLFDRAVQDAQEEYGSQQQDIASKILQKMAPMIIQYAQDNGFGMIVDTSKPWPQSPILVAGEGLDITKPVVDLYNAKSGVAASSAPTSGAARPAAPRAPTGTTHKATTPSEPKQ
ncbi:MAG TPA: OmpH family outer membrane protein [Candidatus Sulfotelmatobacter sp.]|nr:OmpH family outer membrane protein [Candidatus Sulfotelmatobacter sp.]